MDRTSRRFVLYECVASPATLVAPKAHDYGQRIARLARPNAPAVILGSTQPEPDVDLTWAASSGISVVRRRSGGGAVLVLPGAQVWLELYVPASDPLYDIDVARATWWVGDLWQDTLATLVGPGGLGVHRGAPVVTPWSKTLCFSGLGPGEVSRDGRKIVGIAQRRNRYGAWFFTMAHTTFDPIRHTGFIAITDRDERAALEAELSRHVGVVDLPQGAIEAQLAKALA